MTRPVSRRSWGDVWRLKTTVGDGLFVFSDLRTNAMIWQLEPVPCDGRGDNFRQGLHRNLTSLLGVLPEQDPPWVLQWFLADEPAPQPVGEDFCPAPDPLAQQWRQVLDRHLARCRKGLFRDPVSGTSWRVLRRNVHLVLYRAATGRPAEDDRDMMDVAQRLHESLAVAGVQPRPLSGRHCLRWLSNWLIGRPVDEAWEEGLAAIDACFEGSHHCDLPLRALCGQQVRSDGDKGLWHIGERLHRFLPLAHLAEKPQPGALTAELQYPDGTRSFWDRVPPGAVLSLCLSRPPASRLRKRLIRVLNRARGAGAEASAKRDACRQSLQALARGESVVRVAGGLYLTAADEERLEEYSRHALALFAARGWQLTPPRQDHFHLDSWCSQLPGNFDPTEENRWFRRRSSLWYSGDLAASLPLYGRSRGTGTPGALFFNRGGEPLICDPMSRSDRVRNAHTLIIGPTGSGKTALLIYLLLSMAARHRPRIFLVTTLPTFDLLGSWLESCGWTVHRVQLKAGDGQPIPPFAGALEALNSERSGRQKDRRAPGEGADVAAAAATRPEEDADGSGEESGASGKDADAGEDADAPGEDAATLGEDAAEEAGRDRVNELELIASLMVSSEREQLQHWQSDLLREAVLQAAAERGADPMVEDVVARLKSMGADAAMPDAHRQSVLEMAGAMNRYTRGIAGTIFNRPGALWPDADCTILDLGIAGRKGYEHLRTLAYITFIQRINDRIESAAAEKRQTLVVTDEAHVILGEPQLAAYLGAITAQWRTWGAWKWVVTQSLRQIPESSRGLLNMMEWWWCLGLDRDEVSAVSNFRGLGEEQAELLLDTRKEPGKYVEAVVISDSLQSRFRSVLPTLALALAQTEKEERAQRLTLARSRGLTELQAALEIARSMEEGEAP